MVWFETLDLYRDGADGSLHSQLYLRRNLASHLGTETKQNLHFPKLGHSIAMQLGVNTACMSGSVCVQNLT